MYNTSEQPPPGVERGNVVLFSTVQAKARMWRVGRLSFPFSKSRLHRSRKGTRFYCHQNWNTHPPAKGERVEEQRGKFAWLRQPGRCFLIFRLGSAYGIECEEIHTGNNRRIPVCCVGFHKKLTHGSDRSLAVLMYFGNSSKIESFLNDISGETFPETSKGSLSIAEGNRRRTPIMEANLILHPFAII